MRVEKLLQKANKLIKQGRQGEAVDLYQKVLELYPKNLQARQALDRLAKPRTGHRHNMAMQQLVTLFNNQQFEKAELLAKQLLNDGAADLVVYNVLGASLASQNKTVEAIKYFQEVIRVNPDYVEGYNNLGTALIVEERYKEALEVLQHAVRLNPDWPQAYYNLGIVFSKLREYDRAIRANQHALKLAPENINVINNLSALLNDNRRYSEAIEVLSILDKQQFDNPVPYTNRALAHAQSFNFKLAEEDFLQAKDLGADFSGYYQAYSELLVERKQYKEALDTLDYAYKSIAFAPELYHSMLLAQCYSNYEYTSLQFSRSTSFGEQAIKIAHKGRKIENLNELKQDRTLRIGYVSPDFNDHSVARFFQSLVANHSSIVETYCYYCQERVDEITTCIKNFANHWRQVDKISDLELADLVVDDQIDILVDLAGHTTKNRLQVFAMKPAPVQVTWLGYPDTTGLSTIDYRMVDEISDPLNDGDAYHAENLYRLPRSFLSYLGDETAEKSDIPPCLHNNVITFGSFNNVRKLTLDVIKVWCQILNKVENSRLLLKAPHFEHETVRKQYEGYFLAHGVEPNRLRLIAKTKTTLEHLSLYKEVDLCLDTFPYNGTTTTCEALWMGVPVIAYTGNRHSARVSASILKNSGMDEWVAEDIEGYISIAVEMANRPEKLRYHRTTLREQMKQSSICDHQGFAKNMEEAYQEMWQKYLGCQ